MGIADGCVCQWADPPVYRLYRPSISPEPSEDGSRSTGLSHEDEEPINWEAVPDHFVDETPDDHWRDDPGAHLDDDVDASHEQPETEQQPWLEGTEDQWIQWMPSGVPQVIDGNGDEKSLVDRSISILERLADFLDF